MEPETTVRTAVIDAALADTDCTDADVLAALCDCHLGATRAAAQSYDHLLDFEEYAGAGRAL
jgi:hypothetical protein